MCPGEGGVAAVGAGRQRARRRHAVRGAPAGRDAAGAALPADGPAPPAVRLRGRQGAAATAGRFEACCHIPVEFACQMSWGQLRQGGDPQKIWAQHTMLDPSSLNAALATAGLRSLKTIMAQPCAAGSSPHKQRRADVWLGTADDHGSCSRTQGAGGLDPGQYRLVAQFPRRVFLPGFGDDMTLGTAGLTATQEALLVEPV